MPAPLVSRVPRDPADGNAARNAKWANFGAMLIDLGPSPRRRGATAKRPALNVADVRPGVNGMDFAQVGAASTLALTPTLALALALARALALALALALAHPRSRPPSLSPHPCPTLASTRHLFPCLSRGSTSISLYIWQEETAQLVLDYMEERLLPDQLLLQRARAARHQRTAAAGEEERCPRLFQSVRAMPLDEAFRRLDVPEPQLAAFRESGAHMAELRRRWRTLVLANHPDKLTHLALGEQETARRTATFSSAMAAFEAVDAFYADHCAQREGPLGTMVADQEQDHSPCTAAASSPPWQ